MYLCIKFRIMEVNIEKELKKVEHLLKEAAQKEPLPPHRDSFEGYEDKLFDLGFSKCLHTPMFTDPEVLEINLGAAVVSINVHRRRYSDAYLKQCEDGKPWIRITPNVFGENIFGIEIGDKEYYEISGIEKVIKKSKEIINNKK